MRTSTRYLLILPAILFFQVIGLAQHQAAAQTGATAQLVNSGEILQQGRALHDDGKYKEALALYSLVPPTDTNYEQVLHEKSLSAYMDSDIVGSLHYADTGMMMFPEEAPNWYMLRGDALDNMGLKDSSLREYDKALKLAPKKYEAWFNKGVALFGLDRYTDAEACFEQCVLIYPYHASAHYFLGLCALQTGNPVPGLLSFMASLMVNPEGRHAHHIVRMMTLIANVDDEVAKLSEKHQDGDGDHFEMEQELLMSKVALDKQYKLQTDVEDAIVRQMQALLEKTSYRKDDPGFWMQFYVPFFKSVYASGSFNTMVHEMFGGMENKPIDEWNKRHKTDIEAFTTGGVSYFNHIQESEMLDVSSRDTVTRKHLVEDGVYQGQGAWHLDKNNKKVLTGPWVFYYNNGVLRSLGNLDEQQRKQGLWMYYYPNGQLKERSEMKDDLVEGRTEAFFDNGVRGEEAQKSKGDYIGVDSSWYYNGMPRSIITFVNGARNGTAREYTNEGLLSTEGNFVNSAPSGDYKAYYNNHQLSAIAHFDNGQEEGILKRYNRDGVLTSEATYVKGVNTGVSRTYYDNGKLEEEYAVVKGDIDGLYKSYYSDGQVKQTQMFEKGKLDGQVQNFTESGRVYEVDTYEKGQIREIICTGPDGKVLSTSSLRHGAGNLQYYDSLGHKMSEGYYSYKGDKEGNFTYYFADGKVSGRAQFKGGLKDGSVVHYYYNGQMEDSVNYKDGQENGYYANYYLNGQKKEEGYYDMGSSTGPFYTYDEMGNLSVSGYFKDGGREGRWEWYSPAHRKTTEEVYHNGWMQGFTSYDTSGRAVSTQQIPAGDTSYQIRYGNGKLMISGHYRNYHVNGANLHYFFDQTPKVEQYFYQDLKDSIFRQYYYGGKLETKGAFVKGTREGTWYSYYENGKLENILHYRNDNLVGIDTIFNEDGTLYLTQAMENGTEEGPLTWYGDNNLIAYITYFHNGKIYGYSYLGKDGKLLPVIALPAGFGKIVAYYANGQQSVDLTMVDGETHGMRTHWFSNGKLDNHGEKLLGKQMGKQLMYYPNGKIRIEQTDLYDNLQGEFKSYYPSGVLKEERHYYNGQLEGLCKSYDENGHLVKTEVYYYDELQAAY